MQQLLSVTYLTFSVLSAAAATFIGAPEPAATLPSPATPAEQKSRFSLPPEFEIELVSSEEQGVGKPVTLAWDDSGRMWTITALEYPLDGNEQPEAARALYAKGGKDRVLVFDDPYADQPHTPRVFADGLAMPLGILPYKDGAFVGHGPDVLFLRDRNDDGKADAREVILTGFGIQDSHLMPHQFARAPGGWFYLAQGAFNYSRVKTRGGREIKFDQTRLARFTPDGMRFEDLTSGPCNIWGLVIGREGEAFIQEANDYGYPVMPFHADASYPGCTGAYKPYAPYFPSEIEFRMGGTGLSGLASSDPRGSFPGPYANVMYVANPITRKIQAIKIHRDGPWYRYEKLPDFVLCADEWFRPVAIHFGPDGCLYIVDWYNKIISHNEVPRTHPERDKSRGRIWRVRHKDQQRVRPPDVARAGDQELLKHLQADSTWEMRAAWHQIADRNARELAPELKRLAENTNAQVPHRIHVLWTLEELGLLELGTINKLRREENRNLRREAIRSIATIKPGTLEVLGMLADHTRDSDPEVRAEVLRVARAFLHFRPILQVVARMALPSLAEPIGKSPHNGAPMKLREAYDRDFERYLIRAMLEENPDAARNFLQSMPGKEMSLEAKLLFTLALPPNETGDALSTLLREIDRVPNDEELLRLTENLDNANALETLQALLAKPGARELTLQALLKVRNRVDLAKIAPLLTEPVKALWGDGKREFAAQVAGAFKLRALAPEMEKALGESAPPLQIALLKSLREVEGPSAESLASLVRASTHRTVKDEALNSLVTREGAGNFLVEFWPQMNAVQRRSALRSLTASAEQARLLKTAIASEKIHPRELDSESLEKLGTFFPADAEVKSMVDRLVTEFQPVLRLDGRNESFADANINLEGPFTVECWVRLDSGIGNEDGILGVPGGADFNFAGGKFRVWCGPDFGDRAVSRRTMASNAWTHLSVTRDSEGVIRLYINGEIESTDQRKVTAPFAGLDIGRTTPNNNGTTGDLTEFRVWNRARSAEEIRGDFDRTYAGETLPSGLTHYFTGAGPWPALKGGARVEKVYNAPALLTAPEALEQQARFVHFRRLAENGGEVEKGKALFALACSVCHSVGGQGGQIGPVLDGAAANGTETLLRAILTPNAAMEAGYRNYRVELISGERLDGFLVGEDENSILLRQANREDQKVLKEKIRRAEYTQKSLMPDGLLETMHPEDVRDLFAYLRTLK